MSQVCKVDPLEPDRIIIKKAAEIIRKGGLVAFPTETVYGLGANALSRNAVKKIYAAKGRPLDNPLIVHVSDKDQIQELVKKLPDKSEDLIKEFFPGPLTIVLEKREVVPNETTAGLPTVAIRMPRNAIALSLIKESKTPIAAPSANKAGRPSPTRAQHVLEDLNGDVDLIIDGGPTEVGLESTVVDLTVDPPQLLRPGGITLELLIEVLGSIQVHPSISQHLARARGKEVDAISPGMKYKHYAPKANLTVIVGKEDDVRRRITELIHHFNSRGLKIGVAATTGKKYKVDHLENLGESKEEIAKGLFDVFRRFDKSGVDVILAEGVDEEGLGLAIMNRLKKASGYTIIEA